MAKFLNSLKTEDVNGGHFKLLEPLFYESDLVSRHIIVPAGFDTDLASVPRVPLMYWLVGGKANYAATIHDYLYSSGGMVAYQEINRKLADDIFLEGMTIKNDPDKEWKRKSMYRAVRLFGWLPYNRAKKQLR